jgi:hypothetical protein
MTLSTLFRSLRGGKDQRIARRLKASLASKTQKRCREIPTRQARKNSPRALISDAKKILQMDFDEEFYGVEQNFEEGESVELA